jgi:hypothetical protein
MASQVMFGPGVSSISSEASAKAANAFVSTGMIVRLRYKPRERIELALRSERMDGQVNGPSKQMRRVACACRVLWLRPSDGPHTRGASGRVKSATIEIRHQFVRLRGDDGKNPFAHTGLIPAGNLGTGIPANSGVVRPPRPVAGTAGQRLFEAQRKEGLVSAT